jgi:hypothetical protein
MPTAMHKLSLVALRLADRGDIANDVVAHKIMEHAKTGSAIPSSSAKPCCSDGAPSTRASRRPRFLGSMFEANHRPQSSSASVSPQAPPGS